MLVQGDQKKHVHVFLVPSKMLLVQCTLDKSLFKGYQNNMATFNWSSCNSNNYSNKFPSLYVHLSVCLYNRLCIYLVKVVGDLELLLAARVELLGAGHGLDQLLHHDPVIDANVTCIHLKQRKSANYWLNDFFFSFRDHR